MTTVNVELLDLVEEIITKVPALHDQLVFAWPVDPRPAREQRARHPELPVPESCETAFCVAGWAMIAAGYTYTGRRFHRPGDQRTIEQRRDWERQPGDYYAAAPILEAAALLGIDPSEAYSRDHFLDVALRGIFHEANNLAQIRIWMRYYRGEVGAVERSAQLLAAR